MFKIETTALDEKTLGHFVDLIRMPHTLIRAIHAGQAGGFLDWMFGEIDMKPKSGVKDAGPLPSQEGR